LQLIPRLAAEAGVFRITELAGQSGALWRHYDDDGTTVLSEIAAGGTIYSGGNASGNRVLIVNDFGAWSSRTPTATNLTLGTGGINTQTYQQVGKMMHVAGMIVLGTSGALTGTLSVDVPVAAKTLASMAWVGAARYQDVGTQFYPGTCDIASGASTIGFRHNTATNNGSVGASGPFAFAASDTIHYSLVYEVA